MNFLSRLPITLLVFLFLMPASSPAKEARKPLSPLHIRIETDTPGVTQKQIKPGDVIQFTVSGISFMDVEELRIAVELTGGAKLIAGDTSWSGQAKKNEEKKITFTVQAPKSGHGQIRARISLPPTQGGRFSAEARFDLGPKVREKFEHELAVKKDSKGRDVIEYR